MTILAIDQGTTSTRAVEIAPDGAVQVLGAVEHVQGYPRPGLVEHDPLELLRNVEACLARAAPETRAVGLANQGESCLGWDRRTGAPVTPVIVWQDERTADLCARLRADGAEAQTLGRAGLPLDPYFSASKLGWIVAQVPEARRLAATGDLCLGTTDAFFRHRLTGRFETDVATASRTSLMDLRAGAWDADLCALFGVPVEALPEIGPTHGDLGDIAGRPLGASLVDQQAALYGHGCRGPGETKITFGTGAFVQAVAGGEMPPAGGGPLPTVAWTGPGGRPVYALDGGVHTAAAALNWARRLGLFSDWAAIDGFAQGPAVARGLVFVPSLAGLACPHWDRGARGTWMGLGLQTGPLDMVQAILEGVAFRAAEVVAAVDAVTPVAGPVSLDGGMTRNRWFCQFLADALGREVRVSAEVELTALGVALLAAEGAGVPVSAAPGGTLLRPRPQPAEWEAAFRAAREAAQAFGLAAAADADLPAPA